MQNASKSEPRLREDPGDSHRSPSWSQAVGTSADPAGEIRERTERTFQRLFDSDVLGVIVSDVKGRIIAANTAFLDMLDYRPADLPLRWSAMTPPEWRQIDKASISRVMSHGTARPWEKELFSREGRRVPVLVSAAALIDGTAGECMGIVLDLSEQKRVEQEILEQRRQLRALAAERALAEERERRRIAAGLHDDLGQTLAVAKLRLSALRVPQEAGVVLQTVDEIRDLMDQAIRSARSLTFELSSPVLYELGLAPALGYLGEKLERDCSTRLRFESDGTLRPPAEKTSIIVYGVVRELLHNVAKHAQARHASLTARTVGDTIRVSLEDDGVGFDTTGAGEHFTARGGFGLFSAQERLVHIGGRLEIESSPGKGTRAVVIAPLEPIETERT